MTSRRGRYCEQNKLLKEHALFLKFTSNAVVTSGGGSFLTDMSVVTIFSNKCYFHVVSIFLWDKGRS
jgi:hypothetical protein